MLRSKIEGALKDRVECPAQGLEVRYNYAGEECKGSWLSIHRSCWKPYEAGDAKWEAGRRAAIVLECDSKGPAGWWYSIKPLQDSGLANDDDRRRFTRIQNISKGWSAFGTRGYTYVDHHFRNWATLIPELARECSGHGGEVCEYYLRAIVEFAVYAIPHIDKTESESESGELIAMAW